MSAEDAFAQAEHVGWGPNLPQSDDQIDYSDIPPQDWSGSNVVRGKYREMALAAQGLIAPRPRRAAGFPQRRCRQSRAARAHRNCQQRQGGEELA
jgi:hypothetical protein